MIFSAIFTNSANIYLLIFQKMHSIMRKLHYTVHLTAIQDSVFISAEFYPFR